VKTCANSVNQLLTFPRSNSTRIGVHEEGSTDSEVLVYLALTYGLEHDPPTVVHLLNPGGRRLADGAWGNAPSSSAWWLQNHLALCGRSSASLPGAGRASASTMLPAGSA
jgi:hypothetical protein